MSNWPLRFVHAADLHLEMPPFGMADVPEHLADTLLDAPYRAAQRVFETALAEQVDFVVLAGDVLHCQHTGPRGPLFLVEQFRRLAQRNIAVYWAPGRVDPPEAWPPSIHLPTNVHVFGRSEPEECIHRRDGAPVARLVGAARGRRGVIQPSQFDPQDPSVCTIAIAHGTAEREAFQAGRVDYWALGGVHGRATLSEAMPLVHYAGSPQGRQPEETGPHGCTLVTVDRQRNVQAAPIATDVVRWLSERIVVDAQTGRDDLVGLLQGRIRGLIEASPGVELLVSWTIAGAGPIVTQLRRSMLSSELLERLRKDHGFASPAAWSVSMSVEPAAAMPRDWYEQETIRGDFLRHVARCQQSPTESLRLETYLPAGEAAGVMADAAAMLEPATRLGVLQEAAALGVDLLSGEEPKS